MKRRPDLWRETPPGTVNTTTTAESALEPREGGGSPPANAGPAGHRTPLRAIRAHCLWCCKDSNNEVRLCPAAECPLHTRRAGSGCGRGGHLRAVRLRCLDCKGGEIARVRSCPAADCALWPYRSGHRTKQGRPGRSA